MKIFNKIALFILLFITINCSKSNGITTESGDITCTPLKIEADYTQEQFELSIKATSEWTAFSEQEWIKCNPSSSIKNEDIITVIVDKNNYYKEREGEITLKSGSKRAYVKVSQKAKPNNPTDEKIDAPDGYELVWNDEFDEGDAPDNKWWYETGGNGWGNNELQHYVAGSYNSNQLATIEDGILTITAKKIDGKVYSIRMNSAESWKYGYFEARLKLPTGKGTWPAFWMMPKNFTAWPEDGEIDIMEEVGYNPNYVSSSIHCKSYYHSIGTQKTKEKLVPTAQTEFHIYALEWTEDFIRTFVDGKELFYFENDKRGDKNTWPFNSAFYLKLNLAWGGDWGGAMGVDENFLPAEFKVDYVRVFQKK